MMTKTKKELLEQALKLRRVSDEFNGAAERLKCALRDYDDSDYSKIDRYETLQETFKAINRICLQIGYIELNETDTQ